LGAQPKRTRAGRVTKRTIVEQKINPSENIPLVGLKPADFAVGKGDGREGVQHAKNAARLLRGFLYKGKPHTLGLLSWLTGQLWNHWAL